MLVLIAGGSGYVGRGIVERFCAERDFVNISLTRRSEFAVNNVLVDLAKPLDFLHFDKPIDMIIDCVECRPSGVEGDDRMKKTYLSSVRNLIDYAKENKIKKFIHFSINHIHTVENDYQQAKFVAEGLVKSSGLDYIIFKPTVIFGENSPLEYLIDVMLARSVLLKFWKENAQIAPVHLLDVLANVGYAIKNDDCWNETYTLCGPETMNFEEVLFRRKNYKRPALLSAPSSIARRSMVKSSPMMPRHLWLMMDWVGAADDSRGYERALLAPQFPYKRKI
jgi:NADH dehydrogenase